MLNRTRKMNSVDHPKLIFHGNQVQQCLSQKHFRLFLDNELDFNKDLDDKIIKSNKIILKWWKTFHIGFKAKLISHFINHLSDQT